MKIELTSNAEEIIGRLNGMGERTQQAIAAGVGRAWLVIGSRWRAATGVKISGAGQGLGARLASFSEVRGGQLSAAIGFRKTAHFPYELAQEFGARAKPGKAMVVPVGNKAKSMSRRGMGPRDWPEGALAMRKLGGRAFLFSTTKKASHLEYVLIKSLRPRLKFFETVQANADVISGEVVEAWEKTA